MMGQQSSIFDSLYDDYKIKRPIRLIELFAGYGSQNFGLKYINANYESYKICEWNYKSFHAYKCFHHKEDKTDYSNGMTKEELQKFIYSMGVSADWNKPMNDKQVKALSEEKLREIYNDIKATHNLVDVSKVHADDLEIEPEREREREYVLTYSFPCQDLSSAGKKGGLTASRSGLLWQVERILKELTERQERPNVLIMENVPEICGWKNVALFNDWIYSLEKMGYKNYVQDLSATDYGIPQTRTRTIMVSILGDYNYNFPERKPLKLKLWDLLEKNVDKSYFMSKERIEKILKWHAFQKPFEHVLGKNSVSPTLLAKGAGGDHSGIILYSEKLEDTKDIYKDNNYIYYEYYGTCEYTKSEKFLHGKDRVRVGATTTTTTLLTTHSDGIVLKEMYANLDNIDKLKVRTLTGRESFRLMGVRDEDFVNIKDEFNLSTLYHLAGDSIVVNVLSAVFKQML